MDTIQWIGIGMIVGAAGGALIGMTRRRVVEGMLLGCFFGVLGWIAILFFKKPDDTKRALKDALYQQRLASEDPFVKWEREQKQAGKN